MAYGNMRNVIQGKTRYLITDIINGLICTLRASCNTFCIALNPSHRCISALEALKAMAICLD